MGGSDPKHELPSDRARLNRVRGAAHSKSLWPGPMEGFMTRDELAARLKRAGELEVSGEDQAETDSYFNTTLFRFHGPRRTTPVSPGRFARRSTIVQFAGALSSPRETTLRARRGWRSFLADLHDAALYHISPPVCGDAPARKVNLV
jgi:hypothetical protein